MLISKKAVMCAAGGLAVSFGLGLAMMGMIAVDFKAEEKFDVATFDINPVPDDIPPPQERERPDEFERVETPPLPPSIDVAQADIPSEPITTPEGAIPPFDPPEINPGTWTVNIGNRDRQPIQRIPPIMPPRAERSGHCMMRFDVSAEGAPFNVLATTCTQSLFKRASVRAVQKWKYLPTVIDGKSITETGLTTRISFNLTDERGQLIPE